MQNTSYADLWLSPNEEKVYSQSKEYLVRITPGGGEKLKWGPFEYLKRFNAKAEFFKRTTERDYKPNAVVDLLNPVFPTQWHLSNKGFLITIDNWFNKGYGHILVIYSPKGEMIKAYKLKHLFSFSERSKFQRSVSSIWWIKDAQFDQSHERFIITSANNKSLVFDIKTGKLLDTLGKV